MKRKKISKKMAVVCIFFNIFIWPGLGTIIAGKTMVGTIQIILYLIGFFASITSLPILMLIAWIWGIISMIKIIKDC